MVHTHNDAAKQPAPVAHGSEHGHDHAHDHAHDEHRHAHASGPLVGLLITAAAVPGVQAVADPRVRWLGHRLQAKLHITVNEDLPTYASHDIAEKVRHALTAHHAQPAPVS